MNRAIGVTTARGGASEAGGGGANGPAKDGAAGREWAITPVGSGPAGETLVTGAGHPDAPAGFPWRAGDAGSDETVYQSTYVQSRVSTARAVDTVRNSAPAISSFMSFVRPVAPEE